jgi:hypothetical protein
MRSDQSKPNSAAADQGPSRNEGRDAQRDTAPPRRQSAQDQQRDRGQMGKQPQQTGQTEHRGDRHGKSTVEGQWSDQPGANGSATGANSRKGSAMEERQGSDRNRVGQDTSSGRANGANAARQNSPSRTGETARDHARDNGRAGASDVDVTGSIRVDHQKAGRIHDELVRSGPKANLNIDVRVGTEIPAGRVRFRPVPASIVSISPEFRGYDYVVVQDDVVIVEPRTHKVVTIIRGGHASRGGMHRAAFSLDDSQRRIIRRDIRIDNARMADVDVDEGQIVPSTVLMEPLPPTVVEEVPAVRPYRYFVDQGRIILVDPATREVVGVVAD